MVKRQENMKIPSELLPVCPHCGKPMTMNLRCDDTFVEDEGWHRAAERYENFLRTRSGQSITAIRCSLCGSGQRWKTALVTRSRQSSIYRGSYQYNNCLWQNDSAQNKSAHAEIILPGMSAFPAVVKFFAFHFLSRGGEGPGRAFLVVQLFARLLAELFARDKFRHEVHILSSMLLGMWPSTATFTSSSASTGLRLRCFSLNNPNLFAKVEFHPQ